MSLQAIGQLQPGELRLSWELAKRSFQRQLTYRAATLAGLTTNFFLACCASP